MPLTESIVDDAALTWFGELGYSCLGAEALTPSISHGERESYGDVLLVGRLREAWRRLNPAVFQLPNAATLWEALVAWLQGGEDTMVEFVP